MKRATAIILAGLLSLLLAPPAAWAEQAGKVWRIGYLSAATAARDKDMVAAFREGLRDLGYAIGKNIIIEERYAAGKYRKLPGLAAALVAANVDVMVAAGPAAGYAKNSSATIPIVIRTADPVGKGLVESFTRPGGNVTGLSTFSANLVVKRLELLKEAVPAASRIAVLWYPRRGSSHPLQLTNLEAAAPGLGVLLLPVAIKSATDFSRVFSEIEGKKPEALIVFAAGMFEARRKRIIDFTRRAKLPAIFAYGHWAADGGLMSYGINMPALYRRMASYVAKVLKGAKPADLPIEQPAKFTLTVNLKTARTLGIKIPRSILLRADEVIE
ncbi:MAG: ABC transporter substrate-binding protein [Alphaproteobacteria bacterium]|nr:ABC transporter substrate-binding protein [Alphaproteobacteria bacterium]